MGGGLFHEIICLENLFAAWREFRRGKRKKYDVQQFEFNLEENILQLHEDLVHKKYRHAVYEPFYITDPKLRHIHKACVRDRVVHQAIFRILYPLFDATFIDDSYSCRLDKGTHRGVACLEGFLQVVKRRGEWPIYALKCDIKKFFNSVDQAILLNLIYKKVVDEDARWLIRTIIGSFQKNIGKGLPLGNVTSQLFANIYLNELDRFMKCVLWAQYYVRYCDDFIVVSSDAMCLQMLTTIIQDFLQKVLAVTLHEKKMSIRKYSYGIDFLGYVLLPGYRALRTKTKRRILSKARRGLVNYQAFQSYRGVLQHCCGYKVENKLRNFLKMS